MMQEAARGLGDSARRQGGGNMAVAGIQAVKEAQSGDTLRRSESCPANWLEGHIASGLSQAPRAWRRTTSRGLAADCGARRPATNNTEEEGNVNGLTLEGKRIAKEAGLTPQMTNVLLRIGFGELVLVGDRWVDADNRPVNRRSLLALFRRGLVAWPNDTVLAGAFRHPPVPTETGEALFERLQTERKHRGGERE